MQNSAIACLFKPFAMLSSCLLFAVSTTMAFASQPVSPALGRHLADAIMTRYQPTIDALSGHGWDHSNSIILLGFANLYRNQADPAYLSYIQRYVDTFVDDKGHISSLENTLDGMHPGVLCLFLFAETGNNKYRIAAQAMREHFVGEKSPFQKTPDGAYWHKNNEKYTHVASVDGLYMVYPFLTEYAVRFSEPALLDTVGEQMLLVSERSFNIKYRLPFHAWSYTKTPAWAHPITGTSTQFWSRASGWYAMALVDVLAHLPQNHSAYPKLHYLLRELAAGLAQVQYPADGMWYQVLDRAGEAGNYPDTSATGMITYALNKGVAQGLLPDTYRPITRRGWAGVQSKISVYTDGGPQVTSVAPPMSAQVDYAAYIAMRPVSVPSAAGKQSPHGYMAVLLAAAQMEQTHAVPVARGNPVSEPAVD